MTVPPPPPKRNGAPSAPDLVLSIGSRGRRLIWVLLVVALSAACADDGRELADPQAWQTTTTRPAPPTSAPPQQPGANGVTLSSPELEPGGPVPVALTCSGDNRSPALEWQGVAPETVELAIALSDQTKPEEPLLLWLVTGIDPSTSGLEAGTLPEGAVQPLNDYGQSGWGNPCLDALDSEAADLQFRLYLLPSPSGVKAGDPGNEAWDNVISRSVDSASLLMRTSPDNP